MKKSKEKQDQDSTDNLETDSDSLYDLLQETISEEVMPVNFMKDLNLKQFDLLKFWSYHHKFWIVFFGLFILRLQLSRYES